MSSDALVNCKYLLNTLGRVVQLRRNRMRKRTISMQVSAHAQASSASPRMYF